MISLIWRKKKLIEIYLTEKVLDRIKLLLKKKQYFNSIVKLVCLFVLNDIPLGKSRVQILYVTFCMQIFEVTSDETTKP